MTYTSHITYLVPEWHHTLTYERSFIYEVPRDIKQQVNTIVLNHKTEDHGI